MQYAKFFWNIIIHYFSWFCYVEIIPVCYLIILKTSMKIHPIVFCSISRLLMLYMYVIFISMTFCSFMYLFEIKLVSMKKIMLNFLFYMRCSMVLNTLLNFTQPILSRKLLLNTLQSISIGIIAWDLANKFIISSANV